MKRKANHKPAPPAPNGFAIRVSERRSELGLGLRMAAGQLQISKDTLKRIERGYLFDLRTLAKLCAWCEIDPQTALTELGLCQCENGDDNGQC